MFDQPPKLTPDATTWVMRDSSGKMIAVKVTKMSDSHLHRWVLYFRRKFRDGGFAGNDADLDELIQQSIVTAAAIFREAKQRGCCPKQYSAAKALAHLQLPQKTYWLPTVPGSTHSIESSDSPTASKADTLKRDVVATPGIRRITLDEDD